MAFRFRGKEEIRPSPLLCTVLVSSYKSITISKLNQSKKKARKRTSYTCQKKNKLESEENDKAALCLLLRDPSDAGIPE